MRLVIKGYLRALRYSPRHRCKNSLLGLILDVSRPKPDRISKWWIDDFGTMIMLPSGKLPKCLSPEQEDEWVSVEAKIEPWHNNFGFYLIHPRKAK